MALVILILKGYVVLAAIVLCVYTLRHFLLTMNRMAGEQRLYYQDILDSDLPTLSVLIPMHNEEKVARDILDALIKATYPGEKLEIVPVLEIIPIDDHSTDRTREILHEYSLRDPRIRPLYRKEGQRGKPSGLNDAMAVASGAIMIVFDADYVPPKGLLRDLAVCFKDPEVGAVMGRVIPVNTRRNLLTRLLDMERSSGYQVDQQARHNLRLIPQYGGTVGGFRKDVAQFFGGFNPSSLTEDTELTFKFFVKGWKVVYANRAECYEEAPESWRVRALQIKRWSRGHNRVFFGYLFPLLTSRYLTPREKLDGALLLGIYFVPVLLILAIGCAIALFFLGEMQLLSWSLVILLVSAYNAYGSFAPFYQIGTACFLDGATYRIRLLPFLLFSFFFNMWYVSLGFGEALIDVTTRRRTHWDKTERYRKKEAVT